MVAGDIDLASIGGAVVNTVLAGSDLVAIAVGVPTYGFSLYGRPEVKDIAGLHGGDVAVVQVQVGATDRRRGDLDNCVTGVEDPGIRDPLDPNVPWGRRSCGWRLGCPRTGPRQPRQGKRSDQGAD